MKCRRYLLLLLSNFQSVSTWSTSYSVSVYGLQCTEFEFQRKLFCKSYHSISYECNSSNVFVATSSWVSWETGYYSDPYGCKPVRNLSNNPSHIGLTNPLRFILRRFSKGHSYSQVDCFCAAPSWDCSDSGSDSRHNSRLNHWIRQPQCVWCRDSVVLDPTDNRPEYVYACLCQNHEPPDQVGAPYQLAVACITQGFYCYRVGVLTRSIYAVTVISMVRALWLIKNILLCL